MISFVGLSWICAAPLGLGVFFDFAPEALPQADLWLPHSRRNRGFRLLKSLLDVHVVPPNRPYMSAYGRVAYTPVRPESHRKTNEWSTFRVHDSNSPGVAFIHVYGFPCPGLMSMSF